MGTIRTGRLALAIALTFSFLDTANAFELWGFHAVNHNGVNPVQVGDQLDFKIHDKECSKRSYGDGRNEHDCKNGNVTSYMIKAYHAKPGDVFEYHFEVKVDDKLSYPGFVANNKWDSRLRMFAFLRDKPKNHIYEMKLMSLHGATFMNSRCFLPNQFGQWNSVDMRIKWASDETGKIEVKCNGEIIHKAENIITTLSPDCIITNHCIAEEQDLNGQIHFSFGLRMDGFGPEWKKYGKKSQFTEIEPDGISASYRNVRVIKVTD
jgi:hypothetical protein